MIAKVARRSALIALSILALSACRTTNGTNSATLDAGSAASTVTDHPELLPLNSTLDVDAVAAAICDAKNTYNDNTGNISSCYGVVPPSWSKIMQVFYCQHSVWFDINRTQNAVRACFTGTLQARGGYSQITSYRGAFDFCAGRPEFAKVTETPEKKAMFQYIMLSQIMDSATGSNFPSAAANPRFTVQSQTEAIEKARQMCGIL